MSAFQGRNSSKTRFAIDWPILPALPAAVLAPRLSCPVLPNEAQKVYHIPGGLWAANEKTGQSCFLTSPASSAPPPAPAQPQVRRRAPHLIPTPFRTIIARTDHRRQTLFRTIIARAALWGRSPFRTIIVAAVPHRNRTNTSLGPAFVPHHNVILCVCDFVQDSASIVILEMRS